MVRGHQDTNQQTKTTMPLPSNLSEIRAAAASMFSDPAVTSVNVQASFGLVRVMRDGSIFMD